MKVGKYRGQKPIEGDVRVTTDSGPATPGKAVANALEEALERDVQEGEGVTKKALTYEEILEQEKISKDEAYAIRDALLIDGYYGETIFLTPNTSVRFRTRTYLDFTRFHQAVERAQPRYLPERDELAMRFFLAASLESYGGKTFTFPETKDVTACENAFDERHRFVLSLPEAVVEVLGRHLHKFDRKIRVILSEGAVEDF